MVSTIASSFVAGELNHQRDAVEGFGQEPEPMREVSGQPELGPRLSGGGAGRGADVIDHPVCATKLCLREEAQPCPGQLRLGFLDAGEQGVDLGDVIVGGDPKSARTIAGGLRRQPQILHNFAHTKKSPRRL
ncbi:MAG: hypothetical protein GX596_04270 [Propionibacterium sp.]|nr:hypothetical protein [Propionibacterium sp.]